MSLHKQKGFVQLPFAAGILTVIVAIGNWLVSAWTAAWAVIISLGSLRYAVGIIISVSWLATFVALLVTVESLLPDAQVDVAQTTLQSDTFFTSYFAPWFSYLKPAGLSTYVAAMSATWLAAKVYTTYWTMLDIRTR